MEEKENLNEELAGTDAVTESAVHASKMKKRILIVFAAMLAFAVLYFAVATLVSNMQKDKADENETYRPNTIIFHEADYEYNILKDKDYLALDRTPYLCDESTGVMVSVNEDDIENQDDGFKLLCKMINCIIRGDHEGYNALFSSNYYAVEDNLPEDEFTMQQVYGIKFTRVRKSEHTENGVTYVQYEYEVEYKIRKNNGTFRTDIGSDASRKQYFVMSDSTFVNGRQVMLIDRIIGYNYQNAQ